MNKIVLLFLSVMLFSSCGKELETVTVRPEQSELFSRPDSVVVETEDRSTDDFIHIKIGEVAPIESLDPLFATSYSEWRMIHLLYEGLVEIDEEGNFTPAIAKRWQVNKDSSQYTFYLDSNKRFHTSPVFEGGNGRLVKASDVRFVFQRMASAEVPSIAASNFDDIRGFNAYQSERNQVKSGKWVYDSIEGIRIQNDSTLIFILQKSAPDLLKRLSHPMASVYAPESVKKSSQPIQEAAGTGEFRFIRKEDGVHLLTMVKSPGQNKPLINRLDVVSGFSEKDLYQQFEQEKLDALVELGPSTFTTITDSAGNFLDEYYHNYELVNTEINSSYRIFYNQKSKRTGVFPGFVRALNELDFTGNSFIKSLKINENLYLENVESESEKGQIVITNSTHPFRIYLLSKLAEKVSEQGISLGMNASYAMWNEVTLSFYPYPTTIELLQWETPVYILKHKNKARISIEHQPWNMKIQPVRKTRNN